MAHLWTGPISFSLCFLALLSDELTKLRKGTTVPKILSNAQPFSSPGWSMVGPLNTRKTTEICQSNHVVYWIISEVRPWLAHHALSHSFCEEVIRKTNRLNRLGDKRFHSIIFLNYHNDLIYMVTIYMDYLW